MSGVGHTTATHGSDFAFVPKVWSDEITAYFRKKLVYGQFAVQDTTLTAAPGDTINFPFFKTIGAAENPAVDTALVVDKLSDDSFSATVTEAGKAVGFKRQALIKSSQTTETLFVEAQTQIGRVLAEKIDADLCTEIHTAGNYAVGFTAASAGDKMNVRNLNTARITAFGDKADESEVVFMHSLQYLDMMNDSTAGFMQANALDPWYNTPGFKGRLLGMAVVVVDSCPRVTDIASLQTYAAVICKARPYGMIWKAELDMQSDYDILYREYLFAATMWYAVKSFHSKVSNLDLRSCRLTTTTSAGV